MRYRIRIALDNVIFSSDLRKVLLIKRKYYLKNIWALPAGHLRKDEILIAGAKRELFEETGLKNIKLERFDIFDAINRDPRGRTISVAYVGISKDTKKIKNTLDDFIDFFDKNELDHEKRISRIETNLKLSQPSVFV